MSEGCVELDSMNEKSTFIEKLCFSKSLIHFNEFNNVRSILSSVMKTKLLLSLYNNKKRLNALRVDLKKPSAPILQGLKELEKNNLINKFDKYYFLSSTGHILTVNLLQLIDKWYSIERNIDFWRNHDISPIPQEYLEEIAIFKNAENIVSDENNLTKPLNEYLKLISNANRLKIILPIFSKAHLDAIIHSLDNNCSIELIVDENIFESIANKIDGKKLFKNLKNNEKRKNLKIWIVKENLKLFFTICEDFLSLSLFFEDGEYNNGSILVDKSEKGVNWGLKLFNHYKKTANPVILL